VADIPVQLALFESPVSYGEAHSGAPTIPRIAQTRDDFAELLREIDAAERIAFDTETTGVDMTRCDMVGMSLTTHAGIGWYLPVDETGGGWHLPAGSPDAQILRDALNHSRATLAAHNAKFDLGVLKRHGMEVTHPVYDTMIAQFAIDPFARGTLGLKSLDRPR